MDPTDLIDVDGNGYSTVELGDRIWMAENLRRSRFRNGDIIPLIGSGTDSESAWSETTNPARTIFRGDTDNIRRFGYLYNYHTVSDNRGVCPDGWRVPDENDWKALEQEAGMPSIDLNRIGWSGAAENAGGKLKSTRPEDWDSPNEGATDEFGFKWVAGSTRYAYGAFENANSLKVFGGLWSASESDQKNAYRRLARFNRTDIRRNAVPKNSGLSIRCVTDFTVSSEKTNEITTQLKLEQNYPNPFNPSTSITIELPFIERVKLSIFDVLGREVAIITDKRMGPGSHTFTINTSSWASGVYIYRLETRAGVISKQMTLTK